MARTVVPAVAVALAVAGCPSQSVKQPIPPIAPPAAVLDPHSFARPDQVAVRHVSLDLTVDFTQRILFGTARLSLSRRDPTAPVRLDTHDLAIEGVATCGNGHPLAYAFGPPDDIRGRALVIEKPTACVAVRYRTRPDARALLWVEPQGTAGKKAPMLFTQSQPILARTWVPLQDTPSVRFTYDATIHVCPPRPTVSVPAPTSETVPVSRCPDRLWVVMSATNVQTPPADGVWRFRMDHPIPSYLMALAVGDLAFRSIGPRTGVYAEPSVVDAAAREFAEVEDMMKVAETLYGPYRWGRYDVLVLPPSFPYGGMENPRLTFLTPTAITGDRSLVSLIAHELAHSWSGNLVTNATWSDFWLNEGFTSYVEGRIMEALRGREAAEVLWHMGDVDFLESMGETPGPDTRLALEIGADRDPDDVPSSAAYDKGSMFLRTLETTFGRAAFDDFMHRRFDRLAFTSTTTAVFEADVRRELIDKYPGKMTAAQLAAWLHDPGLPPGTEPAPSKRVGDLEAIATAFATSGTAFDPAAWSTLDWVIFLRALPATISLDRLQALDARFHLTASSNAEIGMHWLPIAVRADDRDVVSAVQSYLMKVGRRRNINPLYAAMMKRGAPWDRIARETFEQARRLYHPIVRDTIARMVGTQ